MAGITGQPFGFQQCWVHTFGIMMKPKSSNCQAENWRATCCFPPLIESNAAEKAIK